MTSPGLEPVPILSPNEYISVTPSFLASSSASSVGSYKPCESVKIAIFLGNFLPIIFCN